MRKLVLAAGLALAACAAPGARTTTSLVAADAATSLMVGERVSREIIAHQPETDGMDPLVVLVLRHPDGRTMNFQEANHSPNDVRAQAAGGPLAQVMGLFGDEAPVLYHSVSEENEGAPFVCSAEGPTSIGVYQAPDGTVQIIGLAQSIEFETLADGSVQALPYSPDQVCARLRFRAE